MTVRARYAGAPTGDLHVGNVRTALFNWLFARHEGGGFIIRVEDTDPEKAKPELIEPIFEALRWLGLDWDEGPDVGGPHAPYRQSERGEIYREALQKLEREGKVYRCYCTRAQVIARGTKTGYDRFCRSRTDRPADKTYALRFAVPEGRAVVLSDLIRGEVSTPFEEMQDFVVARSDGSPTFVLANTVDDIEMKITHVIRGTDLLSVAAQNSLVFEALGADPPIYAHVPLILAPDKSRLGARHGAVGILAYRAEGYLAEAMTNYLALLGWSSPSGEEILDKDTLVKEFTLDRVLSSGAVFDRPKLDWMNQQYMQKLEGAEFERRVLELYPDVPQETLRRVVEADLIATRVVKLSEVPGAIRYLHERPVIDPGAATKWLGTDEANQTLRAVAECLQTLEPWTAEAIKESIQTTIAELGLHKRKGPKPIFVAISGSEVALPLFDSIWLLGRDESVARLQAATTG